MDEIRFLLIHPASGRHRGPHGGKRSTERFFQYSVLPCLYVAGATPAGVRTQIIDEDVETLDLNADVDLVGLSFMSMNAPRAYEIAKRFRSRGIPVVAGGYHPTLSPEDTGRHVDAVCIGEAEALVPRIIEDFRNGGLQKIYGPEPPDLADIPMPDRSLVPRSKYIPIETIQATRGCPHHCTYCSITAFHDHTYRRRPIGSVIDEIKTLKGRLFFADDNLIADREYASELFAAMKPLNRRWYSQASTRVAQDDEMLQRASDAGCRGLFIGFESLSRTNLESFRKGFNRPDEYARAIRNFHRHGICVFVGIVFGMDDDDSSVFRETLEFLNSNQVDFVGANILTPFPGTPLHDEMDRAGRIRDRDWSHYDFNHAVFEPKQMSAEELLRGTAWFKAQFYSPGSIARRITRSFGYLDAGTVLRAVVPLNVGLRRRMSLSGTLELARQA